MYTPRLLQQQGFTLLEVLTALAITAILFGTVAGAIVTRSKSAVHVEQKLAAIQFAHNWLVEYQLTPEKAETHNNTQQMGRWQFITQLETPEASNEPPMRILSLYAEDDTNLESAIYQLPVPINNTETDEKTQ